MSNQRREVPLHCLTLKMAHQFKVPSLKRSNPRSLLAQFSTFSWEEVEIKDGIGSGNFGSVLRAVYVRKKEGNRETVAIKKPYEVAGQEKEFLKEVRLLDSVKGHENIVGFIAACSNPLAIMQEYIRFNFHPFGDETSTSSLAQFLCHADGYYDFDGFAHLQSLITGDIISGLSFLHGKDIVHRDLKPANILVSNQHLVEDANDDFLNRWQASEKPIVCKLTDFGESRSQIIQTQTLISSRVSSINRGSPAFMAPEILLKEMRPSSATIDDLKVFDLWALGMVLFVLVNPNIKHPYETELAKEIELSPTKDAREIFEEFIRNKKRPANTAKYEEMHSSIWKRVLMLYNILTKFDFNRRLKSVKDAQSFLYGKSELLSNTLEEFGTGKATSNAIAMDEEEDQNFPETSKKRHEENASKDEILPVKRVKISENLEQEPMTQRIERTEKTSFKGKTTTIEPGVSASYTYRHTEATDHASDDMTNRKNFYSTSEVDSSSDESPSIEISSEEDVIDAECTASDCQNIDLASTIYKNDPLTPVFSWRRKAYTWQEIVKILSNHHEEDALCVQTPINVAHNVSFLVKNAKLRHQDDLKCDDMGMWKSTGTPKLYFVVEDDPQGEVSLRRLADKPKDKFVEYSILKRCFNVNGSSGDCRKIISMLEDSSGRKGKYTLIQYLFENGEHEIQIVKPHGNSKTAKSYRRLLPSVQAHLKTSNREKSTTVKAFLDQAYSSVGDVVGARSIGELPRGPKDLYNARHSEKSKSSQSAYIVAEAKKGNSKVLHDDLWMLLERAKREEEFSKDDLFIRSCEIHPTLAVVLATNRQLEQLRQFCTDPTEFCVLGVDPTFNIFDTNLSLTVTTYRNLRLENKATGKPPVFIGPLLIHQRKDWQTYSKFANRLITEKPEIEAILACGTDGEKALIDGFQRNFRYAIFLRCFLHVKDNIKRELSKRGVSVRDKVLFLEEIFGKVTDDVKHYGLVDCESRDEFERKLSGLKEVWENREPRGKQNGGTTFFDWFLKEKAEDIITSMLKPVRIDAGLGNPPSEYTNNDAESANFIIKHGLNFETKKPHEFIHEIKKIIVMQHNNEERAVFGKGPYQVREQFKHLTVDDALWGKTSHAQRTAKIAQFLKSGMENTQESLVEKQPEMNVGNAKIEMTAEESGIQRIPLPILQTMFEKANELLSTPDLIVKQPGATNGSFIVAGHSNKIYNVTPGQGGALKCDRNCKNFGLKICEHLLAVAFNRGTLKEFICWFKRTKKAGSMTDMALQGGPKSAGKKPSNRKRSNARKEKITKYVDLLKDKDECSPTAGGSNNATQQQKQHVNNPQEKQKQMHSRGEREVQAQERHQTHQPLYQPDDFYGQHGGHMLPDNFMMESYLLSQQPIQQKQQQPQQPHSLGHAGSNWNYHPYQAVNPWQLGMEGLVAAVPPINPPTVICPATLKWVLGTTVSKCYGCGFDIVNPPPPGPDDVVIVHKDFRCYRDRESGRKKWTQEAQNVHFHLRRECIKRKYPGFDLQHFLVKEDFVGLLRPDHHQRLETEFGWVRQMLP